MTGADMAKEEKDPRTKRATRKEALLRIISQESLSTQNDLMRRLNEEGYKATQATVSRDIKELHLVKTVGPDGVYYYHPAKTAGTYSMSHKFYSMFRDAVTHIDFALNQIVIQCHTGMAQAVCAMMDGMEWQGMLGTIAGDDTILVIMRDEACASALTAQLRDIV